MKKFTLEQLKQAISTSVSIREALLKLGVKGCGGNYKTFHSAVITHDIDISHFTGKNLSGRKLPNRRKPIQEYLVYGSPVQSYKLKKYLLDCKLIPNKCSCCDNDTWLNNPIPLELDHINGNSIDNRLENLRLLCPNCHALTPTYRGKNITRKT